MWARWGALYLLTSLTDDGNCRGNTCVHCLVVHRGQKRASMKVGTAARWSLGSPGQYSWHLTSGCP